MPRRNRSPVMRRGRFAPQKPKNGSRKAEHWLIPAPIVVVRCPTGKQGFAEHVARAKLAQYADGSDNRLNRPKRVYYHELCGSWHLTSQETYP